MKKKPILATLILSSTLAFSFDLGNITKDVINSVTNTSTKSSTNSNLSDATVSSGLKEALKIGVDYAVKSLGAKDGYLNSSLAKIPLPDNLQQVETLIRKAGGEKIADDLITSMNSAATKAAPKTADIFIETINKMNLKEATKILNGNSDAATKYFQENTTQSLKKVISPIIKQSMEQNQVASYYKAFNNYYNQYGKDFVKNSKVMDLAKNFGVDSYIPGSSDENLEDYVTNKAIDGLFKMIAQKEGAIRENPIEQTTSLLKKVFGK